MSESVDFPVIELARPMPGFEADLRFALVRLEEESPLCELRSLDSELVFLAAGAAAFFPEYAPEIADDDAALLDLHDANDALVLVVINAGSSLEETTANLVAPVVINTRTRRGAQIVLDDRLHPIAAPLFN